MSGDQARRQALAAIHAGKRALGLEDDVYRDLLQRITGQRSAADLDAAGRDAVLDEMRRRGFERGSGQLKRGWNRQPLALKARALWRSLYELGAVRDLSDAALAAFAARHTGVAALQWADAAQLVPVVEGLKAWCIRIGYTPPAPGAEPIDYRRKLIEAQWQRLIGLGAFRTGVWAKLETWLAKEAGVSGTCFLTVEAADPCIAKLGEWIRRLAPPKEEVAP